MTLTQSPTCRQDSFAGLFQRRDPREAGPILDIERALAKLEKVSQLRSHSRVQPTPLSRPVTLSTFA